MEAIAKHLFARILPQKARLVADQLRGKSVAQALDILKFSNKKAADVLKKVLESALSNAEYQEDGTDIDQLSVSKIFIDEGPIMKRVMPRAKGRADRISKRSSHITIILANR